jgi:hypothetical protein
LRDLLRIEAGTATHSFFDRAALAAEDMAEDRAADAAAGTAAEQPAEIVEDAAVVRAERLIERAAPCGCAALRDSPPSRAGSAVAMACDVAAGSAPSALLICWMASGPSCCCTLSKSELEVMGDAPSGNTRARHAPSIR